MRDGFVYVYGVSAAHPLRDPPAGVDGMPVEFVDHGSLRALVTRLDEPLTATPGTVRAHWRVLRDVIAQAMVLPLRFGTVVQDEELAGRLLERNEAQLTRVLDDLDGVVQVAVKGQYRAQTALDELVRSSPQVRALRDRLRRSQGGGSLAQQIQLGELVVSELVRARNADTRLALDVLEPHSVSYAEELATGDDAAFNLAFLVERDRDSAFGRAVARLRDRVQNRVEIRYLGPLPPFSFVDLDLGLGASSWA
jgi:hypothetical protein